MEAGGLFKVNLSESPDFVAIKHHRNYALTVPAELIKGGFYRRLNALQGKKDTLYTGAAFSFQGFANVFDHVEKYVQPLLVGAVDDIGDLGPASHGT